MYPWELSLLDWVLTVMVTGAAVGVRVSVLVMVAVGVLVAVVVGVEVGPVGVGVAVGVKVLVGALGEVGLTEVLLGQPVITMEPATSRIKTVE